MSAFRIVTADDRLACPHQIKGVNRRPLRHRQDLAPVDARPGDHALHRPRGGGPAISPDLCRLGALEGGTRLTPGPGRGPRSPDIVGDGGAEHRRVHRSHVRRHQRDDARLPRCRRAEGLRRSSTPTGSRPSPGQGGRAVPGLTREHQAECRHRLDVETKHVLERGPGDGGMQSRDRGEDRQASGATGYSG